MSEHALLSPSSAVRWVPCSAAPALEALNPETESTDDQLAGDASHWVAATALSIQRPALEYVAASDPAGTVITEEMAKGAQLYVDYVQRINRETGGQLYIERTLGAAFHPDNWGTPDAFFITHAGGVATVHLFDYKYGYKVVDPCKNWQFLNYAALIFKAAGLQLSEHIRIVFHVIQPRAHARGGPIRTWGLTGADLRGYINVMEHAAHEAVSDKTRTASGDWCYECRGRHVCEAAHTSATSAFQYTCSPTPLHLDADALSAEYTRLLAAKRAVKERLTGIAADLEARLRNGEHVPAYTLDNRPGRLAWDRPTADVIALGSLYGVDLRKPDALLTPTQAADKGVSVAGYSVRKSGSVEIVPTSTTTAAKAFGKEK